MMTMRTSEFPWDSLGSPSSADEFIARLVGEHDNPDGKSLYWAREWTGRPALLVGYDPESWSPIDLPSFKSLDVTDLRKDGYLVIELLDVSMSDMFFKLCQDIISSLQGVPPEALRKGCVLRLERWSFLLKPSRNKLSPEAQKGLIGELLVLKDDCLSVLTPKDALSGWVGPEASPRDFGYGQTFIEVKAKRSSASTSIIISSEDQLSVSDSERLFLCVWELNAATPDDPSSFTIGDLIEATRDSLQFPILQAEFDGKLASAGYFDEDDYSTDHWTCGNVLRYLVDGDFPRIDPSSCPPGVAKVKYEIDLDYCTPYEISRRDLLEALEPMNGKH